MRVPALALWGTACLAMGCATLSQVVALRKVDFNLDSVSGTTIAGVRVDGKQSYRDLTAVDIARLAAAVTSKSVPLRMTVHVQGENPPTNQVTARMIQMEWTLFLKDKETVSGRLDREFLFAPGVPTDVPITVELDLWDFFQGRAQDLFDLALSAAGIGEPTSVSLKAIPTIQTSIGPIRYPTPITIVHREVGQ